MNPVLSGVQRGKEIAESLVDALYGISIKVICTKPPGEYRIHLSEIVVSKLFSLNQKIFKILVSVRILAHMKIFWIACKEISGFYSQVSVLWCQNLLKAGLYKVKMLICVL